MAEGNNPMTSNERRRHSLNLTPPPPPTTPHLVEGNTSNTDVSHVSSAAASVSLLEELFGYGVGLEGLSLSPEEGSAAVAMAAAINSRQTPSEQVKQLIAQHFLSKAWTSPASCMGANEDSSLQSEGQNTDSGFDSQRPHSGNTDARLVPSNSNSYEGFHCSDEPTSPEDVVTHETVLRKSGFDGACGKSGRGNSAPRSSPNNSADPPTGLCCWCNKMPGIQDAAAAAAAADLTGSLTRQVCLLRMQLHEAARALQLEREERCDLGTSAARYQTEAAELRAELHNIRCSRQEAIQQVECVRSQLQQLQHQQHQQLVQETAARQMAEAKLAELRADIERLQQENAVEWSRREQLESESLNWERSNKALKAQVEELLERLKPLEQLKSGSNNGRSGKSGDAVQDEVSSLREQLCELNLYVSQYKKALSCKTVECEHSVRRSEQYEAEVKRLRARVTKLRQDLASTQDELDTAHNAARRLTRARDELQDTVDTLQLKLNHMQSRLRCTSAAVVSSRASALKKLLPHCDTDDDTN
ncbi:hypothetical protein HAZT_HAZT006725 [Hyalella azteca]|nr:hypothetical protein HAZT_HAZT006725 [Hyalella azteca]